VAVDLPGCGGTAAPATWERATITELALDVAELIRAEDLDAPVIVGHSLGAGIGLQLALNEPDLLSGLVLFAPVSTRGIDFAPAGAVESLAKPTLDDQLRLLAAAFHRPPEPATMSSLESVIRRASPIHIARFISPDSYRRCGALDALVRCRGIARFDHDSYPAHRRGP